MRRSQPLQQLVRCSVAIVSLASAAACSSQQAQAPGSATVNGSLNGRTMNAAYAIAAHIGDPSGNQILILIGSRSDMCAIEQSYVNNPLQRTANLFEVGLVLGRAGATAVVGPGTYTPTSDPNELRRGVRFLRRGVRRIRDPPPKPERRR